MAQDKVELTDDMDFVNRYSKFSKGFYLIILGLAIHYYLLLYGASGHQFNPPTEDIISMIVVIIAFATLIAYSKLKEKSGLGFNLISSSLEKVRFDLIDKRHLNNILTDGD